MTILDFIRVLTRRWYVLVLGALLTGLGAHLAAAPQVTHGAVTTVNVLAPDMKRERIMGNAAPDAVAVANVLAARVNGGKPAPVASNPDVRLYSAGIERGVVATVRDEGGQWRSNVSEPIVQVQVVDPDPQVVLARMNQEIDNIRDELAKLEDELKVAPRDRIQLEVNPVRPNVDQVTNYRSRALAGYAAFGLGLTMVAAVALDRRLSRRVKEQ